MSERVWFSPEAPTSYFDMSDHLQEISWEETTGEPADTSRFGIIIPIYHENKHLPGVLSSIELQDIPDEVRVHMMLGVNGITNDPVESEKDVRIALEYLHNVCDRKTICTIPAEKYFSAYDDSIEYFDSGLIDTDVWTGTDAYRNREYTLFQSKTQGKARALNIANKLFYRDGHHTVLSVDANNYPEPSTCAYAYGCMRQNDYAMISATQIEEGGGLFMGHADWEELNRQRREDDPRGYNLTGAFTAWRPDAIVKIGGHAETKSCDTITALFLFASGHEVKGHIEDMRVHTYVPDHIQEYFDMFVRYATGRIQGLQLAEERDEIDVDTVLALMRNDKLYPHSFLDRVQAEFKRRKTSITSLKGFIKLGAMILINEYAVAKARHKWNRGEDTGMTWNSVSSTK